MKEMVTAIVLAAGTGKRMNSGVPKQYLQLRGRPLLYYALQVFQESFADNMILVTGAGETDYCRENIVKKYDFTKVKAITEGGRERYHSVIRGLKAAERLIAEGKERPDRHYVMIHDGARPFPDQAMLNRALEAVRSYGACAAGMPSKDTVKLADGEGFAETTPPRERVWNVQTPQTFEYELIAGAYERLEREEAGLLERGIKITDDAMVVEAFTDKKVKLTEGSYRNIKVTTPEDLCVAEAFLRSF